MNCAKSASSLRALPLSPRAMRSWGWGSAMLTHRGPRVAPRLRWGLSLSRARMRSVTVRTWRLGDTLHFLGIVSC